MKYDPRVNVYWDVKAYAGNAVCDDWLDDFDEQTRGGTGKKRKRRLLGLDNWGCQSGDRYERIAKGKKIKLAYTPRDCTELCGVIDVGPGNEVKKEW